MATTLDLSSFHLSYDDEFNSFKSSPDGSSGYQTTFYFGGRSLPSNGEQEFYSDSSVGVNPFSQSNGQLTITASPGPNPWNMWYNSGLITTEGMYTQTYGYFEMRAELPQGQGMWPAFWLLPADKSWPPEIDALEAFGAPNANGEGGTNQMHVGTISGNSSASNGSWITMPNGGDITSGYHTYGVDWEPDFITYYVDGQQVFQMKTPADANKPMYMLANLAVGGNWPGSAAGETGQMSIDYIRAYSKDPNVAVASQQPVSSPDGASTGNPGGGTGGGTAPTGTGSGPDTVTVRVAEDAFNGNAQFVVKVDGQQVGGIQTATASHSAGQWQDITLNGTFGTGPHKVDVIYLNDIWGGSLANDRNLYVQSVTVDGQTTSTATANNAANGTHPADGSTELAVNGTASFATPDGGTTPPPPTDPTGGTGGTTPPTTSGLTVRVAEDAFNGDAQFIVKVDGQQVGGTYTATASHMSGQWQDVTVNGTFAAGPHDVTVQFVNDAWGGSTATDRNLYVSSITLNGETISTPTANTAANGTHPADGSSELAVNGSATYHATGTATDPTGGTGGTTPPTDPTGGTGGTTPPTTSSGLHVFVSEDAFNGDAQFTVSVDGHQVGGTYTATASWAAGQWQDVTVDGTFAPGPHTVDVKFVNDSYGGSATMDRNLYVQQVTLNGETVSGSSATDTAANGVHPADGSAAMMVNGDAVFHMTGTGTTTPTTDPTPPATTLSTIVLHVAEDAFNGDAQFKVLVDGQQVGGIQTATASHAAGQWQDITLTGDFGTTGPGKVDIQFTNDQWGGNASSDRNLYVQSIDVNGQNFAASTATNTAANGTHPADGSAELAINGTLDFNINHTAAPTDMHLV